MTDAQYEDLFDNYWAFSEGERTWDDFVCFFTDPPVGEDNCFGEICDYKVPPEITLNDETVQRFSEALAQYRWEQEPEGARGSSRL